jgi:hypothetical protein
MNAVEAEANAPRLQGSVTATLAVALLEATRAHDRPEEMLEAEDVTTSLPRRLGLSGVIEAQIQRYETAVRERRRLPLDEFVSLLKLVLRRPDAEPILREAGERVAARTFADAPGFYVSTLRILPRALSFVFVARSARKLLRNITGSTHVEVRGKPLVARLHQPVTAPLEPPGVACALYGSAFGELASLYLDRKARAVHAPCVINGGSICQWTVDI